MCHSYSRVCRQGVPESTEQEVPSVPHQHTPFPSTLASKLTYHVKEPRLRPDAIVQLANLPPAIMSQWFHFPACGLGKQ